MFDDVYLRYIQFRTLHRRFFTNNIQFKMNKKRTSTLCDFCQKEEDSNEHMFLHCKIVKQLWREVEDWISHIGVVDYAVTDETIILGELKKSHWLNSIVFSLLDRHDILEKRWGMMLEYFEEQQS